MNILYIVVPCYNEEQVLEETNKRLTKKLEEMIENKLISTESKILYINDGSKDKTWDIIEGLNSTCKYVKGVKLSRNKGHQNALLAGLMVAKEVCDITISIDADLQDDINVMDKFVEEYINGCDIVFGVRSKRETDSFFKRTTAQGFYKALKFFGVDCVYNHADYRLMSKRALEGLKEYGEVNLFLRGLAVQIGYKTATVEYERNERFAGESKYPLSKMISFAYDGITSFSIKPIRMITVLGLVIFLISLGMLIYSLVVNAVGNTIVGWTSIVMSVWLLGGLQLLAIGIIGEYIGKSYMESKKRPRYIIETII